MSSIDHTPAIFSALGVTPETQPWAYFRKCECVNGWDKYTDLIPYYLLSGTLEADGLAVRLVEIADKTGIIGNPFQRDSKWFCHAYRDRKLQSCHIKTSFAAAVHDALCEALGINKEEKENDV